MLDVKGLNTEYFTRRGDTIRAVRDVSFEVGKGKFFTLLGPSGCGKTTTLRSIAGLERPLSGEIAVNGRLVFSSKRGVFVALNKRNATVTSNEKWTLNQLVSNGYLAGTVSGNPD